VLPLCARAGLVSVGVVALDGTAMAANASREATRSYATIGEEVERMLAEAEQADAAEDAEHGSARGDELPAELADLFDVLCEVGVTDAALGAGKAIHDQAEDQVQRE
jgi:hypothetical protein